MGGILAQKKGNVKRFYIARPLALPREDSPNVKRFNTQIGSQIGFCLRQQPLNLNPSPSLNFIQVELLR